MTRARRAKATYDIGYGKPPKDKQFPKGVSGNPSGRPKKPATMPDVLREGLSKTIEIVEHGQRKTITKMEAVVNRLIDKSIVGDMSASRVLLWMTQLMSDSPDASATELEELDKKVLEAMFQKYAPRTSK